MGRQKVYFKRLVKKKRLNHNLGETESLVEKLGLIELTSKRHYFTVSVSVRGYETKI